MKACSEKEGFEEIEEEDEDFLEGEEQRTSPAARSEGGGSSTRAMHSEQYTEIRTRAA